MSVSSVSFYITGGSLQRDAVCYIERQADSKLYDGLKAGRFCYVLTSRQMGKSSLMVRTAARLREEGFAAAVLDLTAVGQNLSAEQWYNGLRTQLGQRLNLDDELEDFWYANKELGPLQRWMRMLREVVLRRFTNRVVIFIDEIDVVRSLPFSTDEFFAAIRELYNSRAEDPELERLTFCLLGVATPSDLIRDTRITPFNIGERIELNDFTESEAMKLSIGMLRDDEQAKELMKRICYWTGGHPYLTQRLCRAIAEDRNANNPSDADAKCEEMFLSHRAQEKDDNLLFVRERMLRSEVDLAGLLELYKHVHRGKRTLDEDTNPLVAILRLSGIARVENRCLRTRNRIYHRVFDEEWIKANMPDAELRRQRAAFRRGVIRATAIAAVILAVMAGMLFYALEQTKLAEKNAALAKRQLLENYEEQGRRELLSGNPLRALVYLSEAYREGKDSTSLRFLLAQSMRPFDALIATLEGHKSSVISASFSPDCKRIVTASSDSTAKVWDAASGKPLVTLEGQGALMIAAAFSPDGKRIVTASGDTAKVWDADSGKLLVTLEGQGALMFTAAFSPDGKRIVTASSDIAEVWDADSGKLLVSLEGYKRTLLSASFSPDGNRIIAVSDKIIKQWDVRLETRSPDKIVEIVKKHVPFRLDNGRLFPIAPTKAR